MATMQRAWDTWNDYLVNKEITPQQAIAMFVAMNTPLSRILDELGFTGRHQTTRYYFIKERAKECGYDYNPVTRRFIRQA